MRVPGLALLVISPSFVRVFLAPPRYAGRPIAAPTETGSGQATDLLLRAVRGEDCRPAAAPPGGPRPAPLLSTLAGGGRRPDERSAATPPAHPRSPGRGPASPAASCGSRRRPPAEQLPCPQTYQDGYVTVKVRTHYRVGARPSGVIPEHWPRQLLCSEAVGMNCMWGFDQLP